MSNSYNYNCVGPPIKKTVLVSTILYSCFSMRNKILFTHLLVVYSQNKSIYKKKPYIFLQWPHSPLQSNQQKDLTEPSSLKVFPSPLPIPTLVVASRKLPFDNVTIPRRADDHRVDRMPITISYRLIMIVESCNLSSTHL